MVRTSPLWAPLAAAIAPLSLPAAQLVLQQLDVAGREAVSILDVGGGAAFFTAASSWQPTVRAVATQVDWPAVNVIARANMEKLGFGARFRAVDGDLHAADFGSGHDLAIYSNVAHFESPAPKPRDLPQDPQRAEPHGHLGCQ